MWCLQLRVVIWKNYILRKRHWFLTLLEALLPVLLFFLIAYGRSKITGLNKIEYTEPTFNEPRTVEYDGIHIDETHILYTPNKPFYNNIIKNMQIKFGLVNNNIHEFSSEEKLMEYYAVSSNNSIIAIIFKGNEQHFDYSIRYHPHFFSWDTKRLYFSPLEFNPKMGSAYDWQGFLSVQKALDVSFIEEALGKNINNDVQISAQEFPYPPYKADSGLKSLFADFLPLVTLFSFIFLCPAVLKRVIEEKHSGIKELMKMVGMKSWMMWLGWFIYGMVPILMSITVIVMLLKIPFFDTPYPPIEFSNGSVLFLFLVIYCTAAIVFCFFISTWFNKPTVGMIVGILIWIFSYVLPKYILDSYVSLSFAVKLLLNLLPNMALHYGFSAISLYEEREVGIQWNNMHLSGSGGTNDVTMSNVFWMLVFDIVIYMTLTVYFDNINPGKYGLRKSVFYPLIGLKRLLCNNSKPRIAAEEVHLENGKVETDSGLAKGIEVEHIYKKFGKKVVVNDLSLDIYEGRITVLLGHNGAGKTTTMGMITGMLRTTSGSIKFGNKDIEDVRNSLGLCPQHNLLFPDLTVSEHLEFFGKLKGKTSAEARKDVPALLKKLNLSDKANCLAHTLSGGMKRKLCLAMALIGDSKILILDEPTSGMDVESRRSLWDLLLSYRDKKTILITTHFMEEADALGDWIAIMAAGRLLCYGTPMYLKKKYNTGYHLSLIVDPTDKSVETINCLKEDIENKIRAQIPGAQCLNISGNNIVFLLPIDSCGIFPNMLKSLEDEKDRLRIENMAVTITTLEDVFLKTKADFDAENSQPVSETDFTKLGSTDVQKCKARISALFVKRWNFLAKMYVTYAISCSIAFIFLLCAIFLSNNGSDYYGESGPKFAISLKSYGSTGYAYYNGSSTAIVNKMQEAYNNLVKSGKGEPSYVPDVQQAIVKEGIANIAYYREHMIVGAELHSIDDSRLNLIAFYNGIAIHSAPISLNLITNALAKAYLGDGYSISASNWQLPNINSDSSPSELSEVKVGLLWLIMVPIACLFILSSFIVFPYNELSTNFAQLQFMCGVKPWVYWFVNFVADLTMYLFVIVAFLVVLCFCWEPFEGRNEFGSLFLILFLYGLCGIPYTYLFSRRNSVSGAFALFIILGIFLGIFLSLIVGLLKESGDDYYVTIGYYFNIAASLVCPQYALSYSVVWFSQKAIKNYNMNVMEPMKWFGTCNAKPNACCFDKNSAACAKYKSYLPEIQDTLVCMAVSFALFMCINIVLYVYFYKQMKNTVGNVYYYMKLSVTNLWNRDSKKGKGDGRTPEGNDQSDGNMSASSNEVSKNTNTLRARKLKKKYYGMPVVNGIDFNVGKGDCLGILGVNGAGKTTTFKMLTREEVRDAGDIFADLDGIETDSYLEKLGYCPQEDALNFVLTGRQILNVMASLRGIQEKRDEIVNNFLQMFELKEYADIPCGQYSGGNKRKLSLAIALIGFPAYVLLDEPTNGVDPSSRRKFWTLIKKAQSSQKTTFILTSHSMVECEALCNTLTIMKKGEISRKGTISKLKSEVNGYTLKLKLNPEKANKGVGSTVEDKHKSQSDDFDEIDGSAYEELKEVEVQSEKSLDTISQVKEYLHKKYSGEVKDEHSGLLHYYIENKDNKKLSTLFREIEEMKQDFGIIEDYTLCEASLEDVFLSVAREPNQ